MDSIYYDGPAAVAAAQAPGAVTVLRLRGLLGLPEGRAAGSGARRHGANRSGSAAAAPKPWDMPEFGEADADAGDRERGVGGDTQDSDAPDLEPRGPGGAPDNHPAAAGAGDFAELDTLAARTAGGDGGNVARGPRGPRSAQPRPRRDAGQMRRAITVLAAARSPGPIHRAPLDSVQMAAKLIAPAGDCAAFG